jgi:Ni,Fe-hydrogenase III small subunit
MLREFKILRRHGIQYIPDVRNARTSENLTGRPVIDEAITAEEAEIVKKICPAGAINASPFSIDLGKCLFCKECSFLLPNRIRFTNDYKIATSQRENLIIRAGEDKPIEFCHQAVRPEIRNLFRHALKLRQVSAGGDNSCEMELNAAGNVNFDMGRYGIEFVASPRHADGIVITGPISENMATALKITYEAVPEPKIIILAGVDAISGGMFKNSEAINREFLALHRVDLYMPGNPVHPLTFINGILDLIGVK